MSKQTQLELDYKTALERIEKRRLWWKKNKGLVFIYTLLALSSFGLYYSDSRTPLIAFFSIVLFVPMLTMVLYHFIDTYYLSSYDTQDEEKNGNIAVAISRLAFTILILGGIAIGANAITAVYRDAEASVEVKVSEPTKTYSSPDTATWNTGTTQGEQ